MPLLSGLADILRRSGGSAEKVAGEYESGGESVSPQNPEMDQHCGKHSLLCAFGGVYALVRSADYVPLRSDSKIPGNVTAASHRVQLPAHWFGSDGLAADGADCP